MYPDKPLIGTRSNAEKKVFFILRDWLPNDYTVFHSIPIYRESKITSGLVDGEIDFLITHPDKGLIVLEVKGGSIGYDAKTGAWTTKDSQGLIHKIKNPYEQAKDYKYQLKDDIRKSHLTREFNYPIFHAVWFPDIDLKTTHLGISIQIEKITLDANDLSDVEKSFKTLFNESLGKQETNPTSKGVNALITYLAPTWEFSTTLSSQLMYESQQISEATLSQYKVLSILERIPRALISGCAGSGKTLLALEKAKRLSDNGNSVLMVCFNKKLAAWMRKIIQPESKIEIYHFHGLCSHIGQMANLSIPSPDPESASISFFEYELPEFLMDGLQEIEQRYDAMIVDEGQDIKPTWWIPLQELLRDPNQGIFYIFYDDNQSIYNKELNFPFSGPIFPLHENCRNTKLIHNEILRFYRSAISPESIGPEGRKPEFIFFTESQDEKQILKQTIKKLLHSDDIKPDELVILNPLRMGKSKWEEGFKIGNLQLSWDINVETKIRCSTIHSFKGLESPVIIMTELDCILSKELKELLYVGMSRARNHLILILNESLRQNEQYQLLFNE